MTKVVIYASTSGNTEAAAKYIASKIGGEAIPIAMVSTIDLDDVDMVIFGSRVHAGSISKSVAEYIVENYAKLTGKKVAYFVCCMYDKDKGKEQCGKIGAKLNLSDGVFFNGIKKKIAAGETRELDDFVDRINRL